MRPPSSGREDRIVTMVRAISETPAGRQRLGTASPLPGYDNMLSIFPVPGL